MFMTGMSAAAAMQALLLDRSAPQAAEADVEDLRRLKLASHVYDAWTASGTLVAQLADRFLDGSLDALNAITCDRAERASAAVSPDAADSGADPPGIDVRCASELSYEEFVVHYMAPNAPVIIKGVTDGWAAQRDWVLPGGGVNVDFLARSFGDSNVVATDTSRQADGCGVRRDMTLSEYLAWWQRWPSGDGNGKHGTASTPQPARAHATAASGADASESARGDGGMPGVGSVPGGGSGGGSLQAAPLLYLKDWHFASEHPHYQAYTTPHFFQDDWLNDFYDAKSEAAQPPAATAARCCSPQQSAAARCAQPDLSTGAALKSPDLQSDAAAPDSRAASGTAAAAQSAAPASCISTSDYRFVYLGPKGSWTPLHADVLRSFSWSVNVAGAKRWLLLPPRRTHLLFDRFGRQMAPSFEPAPGSGEQYPNLAEARRHVLEVRQGAGDAIFVPSGWHHTVENLEDTLSINHNWLNGWNLHWSLQLLRREHAEAATAIEDCREGCTAVEFEGLVQRNVAANAGLGFAGLAELVVTIAQRELRRLAASVQQPGASWTEAPEPGHPSPAGHEHCAVAEAAASAAEGLAACCGRAGCEADAQMPRPVLQQLHCVFNLRRAQFVLEALEAHSHGVLGDAADVPDFVTNLRQIQVVPDRFDQKVAAS